MRTLQLALAAGAALALLAAPAAPGATLLRGVTGPDFTITLKTAGGRAVKTLAPGRYTIRVSDRSSSHDFRLTGPRLNRRITGVGFKGTKSVTLTLKKGRYTFLCTPHADSMRGSFRVR